MNSPATISPGTDASSAEARRAPQPPKVTIPIVVGTRPEAIKMVPLILALRRSSMHHPIVISTGQHHSMVSEIFDLAGIRVDCDLGVGDAHARLNDRVGAVMAKMDAYFREEFGVDGSSVATEEMINAGYPVALCVHGDTSSAFAAAMAAFHLRIPVNHIEAGLRTGGHNHTPFPEELNRQLITCIASAHFAPTWSNQEQLIREDIPVGQIFVTGNTGIDALQWASRLHVPFTDRSVAAACHSSSRIVVVTAHRRESWNAGLGQIASAVKDLAASHPDALFVIPLHPNPIVRRELGAPLAHEANVLLTEPLAYAEFARLLARADLVITDSGGIQEEAPSLDKPVLVTRDMTERAEGLVAGTLKLVGTDAGRIRAEAERLLGDKDAYEAMAATPNPYGDGHAAERIVEAMSYLGFGGTPPQPFRSGFDRTEIFAAAGYAEIDPLDPFDYRPVEMEPDEVLDDPWAE